MNIEKLKEILAKAGEYIKVLIGPILALLAYIFLLRRKNDALENQIKTEKRTEILDDKLQGLEKAKEKANEDGNVWEHDRTQYLNDDGSPKG